LARRLPHRRASADEGASGAAARRARAARGRARDHRGTQRSTCAAGQQRRRPAALRRRPSRARQAHALAHQRDGSGDRAMTTSPAAVLQQLIRIDTSNPPGGETRAAEYLRTILVPAGVQCTLVARDPQRANLVARISGSGDGPRLAFLCHLDVVPTDTREWSVDPYGGMIRDGQVWGRG